MTPPHAHDAIVADVRRRLESRATDPEPTSAPVHGALHAAAAVLVWFDPDTLRPLRDHGHRDVDALLQDCDVTRSADGRRRWTLNPQTRVNVLSQLRRDGLVQAALDANPQRPADPAQQVFERYLLSDPPQLLTQSLATLARSVVVCGWLRDAGFDGVPPEADLAARMEWLVLLQPLQLLAGDTFRGRARELRQLRDFADASPTGPMYIQGATGTGKSALLAKFIVDHAVRRPPFAYLDFHRPDIDPGKPLTLLVEAVRQLGVQFPAVTRPHAGTVAVWREKLAFNVPASMRHARQFAEVVGAVADEAVPVLFVLDAFERAQAQEGAIWQLLDLLQTAAPQLRVYIAGRSEPWGSPARTLRLGPPEERPAGGQIAVIERSLVPIGDLRDRRRHLTQAIDRLEAELQTVVEGDDGMRLFWRLASVYLERAELDRAEEDWERAYFWFQAMETRMAEDDPRHDLVTLKKITIILEQSWLLRYSPGTPREVVAVEADRLVERLAMTRPIRRNPVAVRYANALIGAAYLEASSHYGSEFHVEYGLSVMEGFLGFLVTEWVADAGQVRLWVSDRRLAFLSAITADAYRGRAMRTRSGSDLNAAIRWAQTALAVFDIRDTSDPLSSFLRTSLASSYAARLQLRSASSEIGSRDDLDASIAILEMGGARLDDAAARLLAELLVRRASSDVVPQDALRAVTLLNQVVAQPEGPSDRWMSLWTLARAEWTAAHLHDDAGLLTSAATHLDDAFTFGLPNQDVAAEACFDLVQLSYEAYRSAPSAATAARLRRFTERGHRIVTEAELAGTTASGPYHQLSVLLNRVDAGSAGTPPDLPVDRTTRPSLMRALTDSAVGTPPLALESAQGRLPADVLQRMEQLGRFELGETAGDLDSGTVWSTCIAPFFGDLTTDPDRFLSALHAAVSGSDNEVAAYGAARLAWEILGGDALRLQAALPLIDAGIEVKRRRGLPAASLTGFERQRLIERHHGRPPEW
ncbi:ATP-binding protein [Dactylosporangium sp. NPDC049742]|uniref:ATP-binding protein n=1 Tax=Dactylosporangium sp. NPDC049742 TaxID=3154737 RepID=UPI00342AE1DE